MLSQEFEWTSEYPTKDEAQHVARRRYRMQWLLGRLRRRQGLSVRTPPPLSNAEVLQRLVELPVSTWTYGWEHESVKHLGPMAQDFGSAFGLGDSDIVITCVDAQGVAFAAIQELQKQIVALQHEVNELKSARYDRNAT